jgi:hypothetical protein
VNREQHSFKLVAESRQKLGADALAALRAHGCVMVIGGPGRHQLIFEADAPDYASAVESAIAAIERLPGEPHVVEITGVPLPMPGLRIETTLTRAEWDSPGQGSAHERTAPLEPRGRFDWRAWFGRRGR